MKQYIIQSALLTFSMCNYSSEPKMSHLEKALWQAVNEDNPILVEQLLSIKPPIKIDPAEYAHFTLSVSSLQKICDEKEQTASLLMRRQRALEAKLKLSDFASEEERMEQASLMVKQHQEIVDAAKAYLEIPLTRNSEIVEYLPAALHYKKLLANHMQQHNTLPSHP